MKRIKSIFILGALLVTMSCFLTACGNDETSRDDRSTDATTYEPDDTLHPGVDNGSTIEKVVDDLVNDVENGAETITDSTERERSGQSGRTTKR